YEIDPDKCLECGSCAAQCPAEAIRSCRVRRRNRCPCRDRPCRARRRSRRPCRGRRTRSSTGRPEYRSRDCRNRTGRRRTGRRRTSLRHRTGTDRLFSLYLRRSYRCRGFPTVFPCRRNSRIRRRTSGRRPTD
ncbi:MAG: 4Fe-4S binding protein, partial [Lentisphaeria bacterium]|nr:4Fe-4S binding protein [Lentisphaeria bacterium]